MPISGVLWSFQVPIGVFIQDVTFFVNFGVSLYIALGHTVSEIDVSLAKGVFDKTVFSMVIPEVETILKDEESRKSVVLFGIEVGIWLFVVVYVLVVSSWLYN